MWHWWQTNFFSNHNSFGCSLSVIPPVLHPYLDIFLLLIRRTRGRSLGTFKQRFALPDIGQHWTEKYFHDYFGGGGVCFTKGEVHSFQCHTFSTYQQSHTVSRSLMRPMSHVFISLSVCRFHMCQVGCLSSRRRLGLQVDLTASR